MGFKKAFIFCFLVILFLSYPVLPAEAGGTPAVAIDDMVLAFDVPPVIIEGRILVPLRAIFESLGAEVSWNQETQTVTARKDKINISLQYNNKTAAVNGQPVTLDVPALSLSGRIMVPVRFIAETLGATVNWEETSRTVAIISNLPYNLSSYHVLENNIKQLLNQENESIYSELETQILKMFNVEAFSLLEKYLRRTYPVTTFENGIYTGKTANSGQGIYEWNSGEKYIGDWKNNKMDGKGIYYWQDGSYYVGEWKDNTKTGWGILQSNTGNVYIGEWERNMLSGRGIHYWSNGEKYLGQWVNDERSGIGYYYWNSGNKISGQFVRGRFSGKGVYTWFNGEKYVGEFFNDKMHGFGKYYFNSGLVFCGVFTNENREYGTYISPGGQLLNLQEAASEIVGSLIRNDMTELQKEKVLHDYVVQTVIYDRQNYLQDTVTSESHTAYGALINKKAVCDGYTELLHILLQTAGIESIFVSGEAKGEKGWEGHAWLIVNIDGTYHHLDVTWNDQDNGTAPDYTYFNLPDSEMEKNHQWDRNTYPVCQGSSSSLKT